MTNTVVHYGYVFESGEIIVRFAGQASKRTISKWERDCEARLIGRYRVRRPAKSFEGGEYVAKFGKVPTRPF